MAFIWEQFHKKCSRCKSIKWVSKLSNWNYSHISQGPTVNSMKPSTWNGMELSLFNDDTCPSGHVTAYDTRAAYRYRFLDIDTNTDTTLRYQYQFDPYRDIHHIIQSEAILHWEVENSHQEHHTQPTATTCAVIMCSGNCYRACQGSVHIPNFFILLE